MKVVSLCGSLRSGSSNATLLRLAAELAPTELEVVPYEGLASLPPFNPDLDGEGDVPPPPVAELRALLGSAEGFILSCPEYAHGVPGAFKNALDWVVSSGEIGRKPMLILNASLAGGQYAHTALVATLTVIEADILPESRIEPFLRARLAPGATIKQPEVVAQIVAGMEALRAAIHARREGAESAMLPE